MVISGLIVSLSLALAEAFSLASDDELNMAEEDRFTTLLSLGVELRTLCEGEVDSSTL